MCLCPSCIPSLWFGKCTPTSIIRIVCGGSCPWTQAASNLRAVRIVNPVAGYGVVSVVCFALLVYGVAQLFLCLLNLLVQFLHFRSSFLAQLVNVGLRVFANVLLLRGNLFPVLLVRLLFFLALLLLLRAVFFSLFLLVLFLLRRVRFFLLLLLQFRQFVFRADVRKFGFFLRLPNGVFRRNPFVVCHVYIMQ